MSSESFLSILSIAEIAGAVRSKKISASEILQTHLQRTECWEPKLNAFVHIDAEAARISARQIDAAIQRGQATGALLGVPVSIKGCIDVAGWTCPAGSLLRKDYVASSDAPLVARLRAAGAILLGNTNTPEFLMAYETDNRLKGKTSNPWSLEHSAGGSSGGESAAIASGCSTGGVGSDGGGSIRVPAHFCGICGLKPTPGRIPAIFQTAEELFPGSVWSARWPAALAICVCCLPQWPGPIRAIRWQRRCPFLKFRATNYVQLASAFSKAKRLARPPRKRTEP